VIILFTVVRLPTPAPDDEMVQVVPQQPSQGAMPAAAATPPSAQPAPDLPLPPPLPARFLPQPPARPQAARRFVRRAHASARSLPVVLRPASLHPAAPGVSAPGRGASKALVQATHPASPDAGSTVYYSATARALGEQGMVRLLVQVGGNGVPTGVSVAQSSGYAQLDQDARRSVLTWHFQPALRGGVPVASVLSYWLRFELR
jgi:periplasmic protein TonB